MRLISALRNRFTSLILHAACVTIAVGGSAASESSIPAEQDAVLQLNVHIDTVVSGGHWCRGKDEGFYRVVVYTSGLEEVYHNLYVQIMKVDPEKHEVVVDRSVPVKEAQGLDLVFSNLTLATASSEPCADALVEATLSRRTVDGPRAERFRMRVTSAGTYQVTFEPTVAP
jgi:hypothetical protein